MARTSEMRLIELMVLKEDIAAVLEFIGKRGTFQFLGNSHNEKDLSDSELMKCRFLWIRTVSITKSC